MLLRAGKTELLCPLALKNQGNKTFWRVLSTSSPCGGALGLSAWNPAPQEGKPHDMFEWKECCRLQIPLEQFCSSLQH